MRFEIRHPNHREEVSSDSDFVVFGRDPSCDIIIRNPRCSRRHASVRIVPEGFRLLDMGSSNGVYVLGQKVDDAIIREGDVFSMGDVFVRILPDDMPATLAMSHNDATLVQASRLVAPPRAPLPPLPPRPRRAEAPSGPPSLLAPKVLALSSGAIGLALIAGPLSMGPQLGVLAYLLPTLGVFSALAGMGGLAGFPIARALHYAVFAVWTLTCLLAPFGVIGITYQLRGENHPDTDSFFAVVIGIGGAMALIALITAGFLARIYVPAPLPL